MRAFHSDQFVLPLPPGHSFPMSKYRLLREAAEATLPGVRVTEAQPASDGELALAHDPAWIDAVAAGTTSAAQQREIGFPWSERMVERARRSVGATIQAARTALFGNGVADGGSSNRGSNCDDASGDASSGRCGGTSGGDALVAPGAEGVAANLAGGTHHAYAHKGSGYCVFNDVAVAARLMQAEWHRRHLRQHRRPGSLLRVIVVDLDVHQGNGTAAIFRDDPSVFTLSLHGAKNFPFRKEASDLDVEFADGTTDAAYLAGLDEALAQAWQRHGDSLPGLAFYVAGADPHENDRLGRLKISAAGLAERDRRVLAALRERRIPVALSMAGGYGRDLPTTVAIQRRTLQEALHAWTLWPGARQTLSQQMEECR